jgi:GntR family transcriptional repressor for pyruvate dehydrogenase complex
MMSADAPSAGLARALIEQIRAGGYRVGDRLPSIRELADALEANPSAVRDALVHAQNLGLVKILPRSGAFVQSLDFTPLASAFAHVLDAALAEQDHNLFHVIDARRLVEVELAGQAASRRTPEDMLPLHDALVQERESGEDGELYDAANDTFHEGIARIAGNPVLAVFQQALLRLIHPYLRGLPLTPERRARTQTSHAAIYRAILEGESEAAREAMREHLSTTRRHLLERIQHVPSDTAEPRPRPETNGPPQPNGSRHRGRPKPVDP